MLNFGSPPSFSVVINSWKRPENIRLILNRESEFPEVQEIIVFNNNHQIKLSHNHPKVRIINSEHDFGLRTRWVAATLALSDYLVFQDDDILMPPHTAKRIARLLSEDGHRLWGFFGRQPVDDTYNLQKAYGEVDVVLTRVAFTHRSVIPFLLDAENKFYNRFGLRPGQPEYCNGDDLLISYCAPNYFKKPNMVVPGVMEELPAHDALGKRPGHIEIRTKMLRECKEVLRDTQEPELDIHSHS